VATAGDDPVEERNTARTPLDRNVDGVLIAVVPGPQFASTARGGLAGATRGAGGCGTDPRAGMETGFGIEHGKTAG
jgi:hypothetical protein